LVSRCLCSTNPIHLHALPSKSGSGIIGRTDVLINMLLTTEATSSCYS